MGVPVFSPGNGLYTYTHNEFINYARTKVPGAEKMRDDHDNQCATAQRLVVVLDECLPRLSWFVFPVRVFQSVGGLEFGLSPCFFPQ